MFRRVTFGPLCLHFVDRSCQNDASGHVLRRKLRWIHCVVAVVLLLAWLAWFRGREATTLRLPDGTLLTLVRLSWAAGATPVPGEGALIERLFREENLVLIRKRTSGDERWYILDPTDFGESLLPLGLRLKGDRVLIKSGFSGHGYYDLESEIAFYGGGMRDGMLPPTGMGMGRSSGR